MLEGAGEYFLEHGHSLSTPQFFSLVRLFGELDMHPPNGFKFWEVSGREYSFVGLAIQAIKRI